MELNESWNSARFAWTLLASVEQGRLGSGLRYVICVTHFCTLRESEELHIDMRELHAFRVQFAHVRVFSDSSNLQKRATKSDTLGHCLRQTAKHKAYKLYT